MHLPLPLLSYLISYLSSPPPSPQAHASAIWRSRIEDCPRLERREPRPTEVWDLRPDDFDYVMALGDSITAGWFAKGIRETHEQTMHEYRGSSYAAGGDEGAVTIPNMIRHYNPDLTGFSLGEHGAEICFGALCPGGPIGWWPAQDQLNAALSGSLAVNLPHQARDYLVPQAWRMGLEREKWKYLNLQIGSNDLCSLCTAPDLYFGPGSPDTFEFSVREALEIVREGIPNTLVNIIGVFDVSSLYNLTHNGRDPYCSEALGPVIGPFECSCSLRDGPIGDLTRRRMKSLTDKYNERLQRIVAHYQSLRSPSFGVTFQPGSILDLGAQPIEALSRADCFHPSLEAHEKLARGVWNRLTLRAEDGGGGGEGEGWGRGEGGGRKGGGKKGGKERGMQWEGKDARMVRCLGGEERVDVGSVG